MRQREEIQEVLRRGGINEMIWAAGRNLLLAALLIRRKAGSIWKSGGFASESKIESGKGDYYDEDQRRCI